MSDTPSPEKPQTSMGCCIGPLVGGVIAACFSLPPPGGAGPVTAAFFLGAIGAFSAGLAVIAYFAAAQSGRVQLSLTTCFLMMLILGFLALADLREHDTFYYGWPWFSVAYYRNEWDWDRRLLVLDACAHLAVISIALTIFTRYFPAKVR